ncbi:MAG: polymer-forming cytoskeletal protein [Cytophagales bacterium]|nr:polymer-forming cytoskeletal protein [Cytophagales bacterium]
MFNKTEKKVAAEEVSNSNIIGKGTTLTGDLETFGNLRVEGKLKGNIKSKSKIAFGQSSEVDGNVHAQNAEIAGHVSGTVEISETLVLKASAVIDGDIVTNKLLVESGATFNGSCKMGVKSKEIHIGQDEPLLQVQ